MLKFEALANVGDKIKAFDFKPMPDRDDSYLVGRVVAKGACYADFDGRRVHVCDGYTVYVVDSRSGSDAFDAKRIGTEIYVPFEVDFLEYDNRISVLEA